MASEASLLALDYWQVATAAALQLGIAGLSLWLGLQLERRLLIATARLVLQLLAVGFVLHWVFSLHDPWLVALLALIMMALATHAAVSRTPHRFQSIYQSSFLVIAVSTGLTLFVGAKLIVGVEPWWQPRYAIPLLGMLLGNALTGTSLCLERLLSNLRGQRAWIETELALGATRWEAVKEPMVEAVRAGMIPTINSMTVAGIVSLPGMMTGQILSGTAPTLAVRYQIVIFLLIAVATSLCCVGVALAVYRRHFSAEHQLVLPEDASEG